MSYNKNKPILEVVTPTTDKEKIETTKEKKEEKKETKKTSSSKQKGKPKKANTGTRKKERDPRVRIAFGVFFMLLSLYILLSTISYVINYKLTGNFGDIIGRYLCEYSFGIGSIYLIALLALAGSLLTFKGPKIRIIAICKYWLVFLLWIPINL